MDNAERIAKLEELEQKILEIKKQKLLNMGNYVSYMTELAKGIAETRQKMDGITDKEELDNLKAQIMAFSSEKDILKEMRFALKFLETEEAKIAYEKARLMVNKAGSQ